MPLHPKSIRRAFSAAASIATLPSITARLSELLDASEVSYKDITDCVNSDPVIAAALLRVVNTSYYGFPARISTISHALTLLGLNVVNQVLEKIPTITREPHTLVGLWEHSLGVALGAAHVARFSKIVPPDEAALGGLLHDLGKIVLVSQFPEIYYSVRQQRDEGHLSIYEAEGLVMGGLTHTTVGGWIAKEANFPAAVREVMTCHHHPERARVYPALTCCVHLANAICHGLNFGYAGDYKAPQLSPICLKSLNLAWNDLHILIDEIDDMYQEVNTTGLYRQQGPKPYDSVAP